MRWRCRAMLSCLFWLAIPGLAQDAHHHHGPPASAAATAAVDKAGTAAAPVFAPPPGSYPGHVMVTLTSATAGATIYYTTDGSGPSRKTSPVYQSPLHLTATTTLKAFAYKKGLKASAVTSGIYTISSSPPPPPPPPPAETGGTLFLAALTPQSGAVSGGSGSAALTLTQDQTAAVLRFSSSGLTGPITSQHIHAADGTILFDVDTAPPQADGSRVWRIAPAGTFGTAQILAALRGGECYLNLHTAAYPAGEIKGFFRLSNGSRTFTPPPPPPPLPAGPPTPGDAARFLLQATYGPRPGEVEALQQKGFTRWLDEQLALPRASHLAAYDRLAAEVEGRPAPGLVRESFFSQAVEGPDQLRQRVAFALSELFVVSDRDAEVRNNPDGLAAYLDLLSEHAFGNFRELLEAVTLSPAMGVYLDMAGSSKALPDLGRNPNENYAREILQLFSIGLFELHPDGTLRLDAGDQPIPTYGQDEVEALARAFTGWTFGGQNQRIPQRFFRPQRNFRLPMESWAAFHDTGEKRFLDAVLPAGQSARTDLEQALDVIVRHPNTGPFVCRSLIQRLVTSNPSPGYVYRCGQAFADDGAGGRGDLGAVVRAILLDYEARSPQLVARQDQGHLREPVVRVVGLFRALGAEPRSGRWRILQVDQPGLSLGQIPLRAPTVFNFFEPTFALPGEIAQAGLVAPEFQITTETTVVGISNLVLALLGGATGRNSPFRFDLTPYLPPQAPTDEALLDRIDLLLFAGAMSDATRSILQTALADPDFPAQREQRVLNLFWLASLAPESVVQK